MAEVQSPGSFQDYANQYPGIEDQSILLDGYTDELAVHQEALAEAHGGSVEELRLGTFAIAEYAESPESSND